MLELAALSDDKPGPWTKADLYGMVRAYLDIPYTDAELDAGLKLSTLKIRKGLVYL